MSGGIVMPSLAAVGLCRELMEKRRSEPYLRFGKLLGYTLGVSALTILTAFCGSLLATSALSQLSYMIEMELYRGVKIMQLIPIGLFILAYLVVYAYEETGARKAVLAHTGTRGEKGRIKRFNTYFAELMKTPMPVSYTHLDVYKRQQEYCRGRRCTALYPRRGRALPVFERKKPL